MGIKIIHNEYGGMMEIRMTIYTEAVAKGRPRVNFNNGKVHTFTPEKTMQAEYVIRQAIIEKGYNMPFSTDKPLRLYATFYILKPKSVKREYPVCRPDIDNYLKTVLDAGNHYLWNDDSQIVTILAAKRYSDTPRIELLLIGEKK